MHTEDYIEKKFEGAERRSIAQVVEIRKDGEDEFFEGYAFKFGVVADIGWFTEEIAPGAADDVLGDDVRGLFNHDEDYVLGRTASGTMTLSIDEIGLKYRIKYNPNDPDHIKVREKVKRGDVSQSSFAWLTKDDKWETKNGKDHRTIIKFRQLIDVAPVTYPAYHSTTVAMRSKSIAVKPEDKNLSAMKVFRMSTQLNTVEK